MAKRYYLRTAWKNDMLEEIQKSNADPASFEWKEESFPFGIDLYPMWILKHIESDFYFKFYRDRAGIFSFQHSPSSPGCYPSKEDWVCAGDQWKSLLSSVREWLSILEEEIIPDLWLQAKSYSVVGTSLDTTQIPNAPISDSEAKELDKALDNLLARIVEKFSPQEEQITFATRQIEHLKQELRQQGKRHWVLAAIGVIASIGANLALSPQKMEVLWGIVKTCFQGVLQLPAH